MKIATKQINSIRFTPEEKNALITVYNLLFELSRIYPPETLIASVNTGELIDGEELLRVRGIIGGLSDNTDWEIRVG